MFLAAVCGSGALAEWLLENVAEVIGIDLSPTMVEEAHRRCKGRARFLGADWPSRSLSNRNLSMESRVR
jgi:ubiquinone/menaquinone biosynthesis C-methylase UbiE